MKRVFIFFRLLSTILRQGKMERVLFWTICWGGWTRTDMLWDEINFGDCVYHALSELLGTRYRSFAFFAYTILTHGASQFTPLIVICLTVS